MAALQTKVAAGEFRPTGFKDFGWNQAGQLALNHIWIPRRLKNLCMTDANFRHIYHASRQTGQQVTRQWDLDMIPLAQVSFSRNSQVSFSLGHTPRKEPHYTRVKLNLFYNYEIGFLGCLHTKKITLRKIVPRTRLKNQLERQYDISFYFKSYFRSTQAKGELINTLDNNSLTKSKFNVNHPTKIVVHGFGGGRNLSPSTDMRNAYFKRGNYNIIIVDYGSLVKEPCLSQVGGYFLFYIFIFVYLYFIYVFIGRFFFIKQ